MKPPEGDPDLLRRAGVRCARLAAELADVESLLASAAAGRGMRWDGAAAAVFGARATEHGRAVRDTRASVERLGSLAAAFAAELTEVQQLARATDPQATEQARLEERIALSRTRFRREMRIVQAALSQVLLRLPGTPARWTGPVVLPPGLGTRPVPLRPGSRWTGPVVLPPGLGPRAIPLPAPVCASPVAAAPLAGGTGQSA